MNLPSREECEGWDQAQVAFFMRKNKMQECAATVNRLGITGHRLLSLSDSDMSKFCLIYQPSFYEWSNVAVRSNMEMFGKLAAPASAKMRQLRKIVQDINKNDNSFLNKIRRLKSKPLPKLPARDYKDADHWSEPDYDNDMHEDLREDQDDSYEPPPSHRVFSTAPPASLPREEYVDNQNHPHRPPRKPLRPGKASKQLPPEPTHVASDEEDYIHPDGSNSDDSYIDPAETPPSNPVVPGGSRAGRDALTLPTASAEAPPRPEAYEVPDKEKNSLSLQTSRWCPNPTSQSHPLPRKPSPRLNIRASPITIQEPSGGDEYEVCHPDDDTRDKREDVPPLLVPKPLPRERSPKPPVKPRPDLKPREVYIPTGRAEPVMQTEQRPPRAFTLAFMRPKVSPPQFASTPNGSGEASAENESVDDDEDADLCNKSWYASTCDRKTADGILLRSNKDGAFMVRKSSGQDAQQPYTLVVFYRGRVYNVPVRFIPSTRQFALGREKRGEEYFSSISHIIENHQRNLLVLIDSQNNSKDATKLCFPVKP